MPRGTSNGNARGSSHDRRVRRAWLMKTFGNGRTVKCFWCPKQMRSRFEVDRYPLCGHSGGGYGRNNIVPACSKCNGGRCGNQHRPCRGYAPQKRRS
jgi:hypothetical protein